MLISVSYPWGINLVTIRELQSYAHYVCDDQSQQASGRIGHAPFISQHFDRLMDYFFPLPLLFHLVGCGKPIGMRAK